MKSKRVSATLAVMLSFVVFGGMVPANAAPNTITTVAGRPDRGDGGAAVAASLRLPIDVALDASGNVYVADTYNHRVRKITTSGSISTVAGTGASGFSGDGGPATSATLRFPEGVWVDAAGNLYIADGGNNAIRKINTSGTISTVAGTGVAGSSGDGGPATAARLREPSDITTDAAGNLYIADTLNNKIRKVNTSGVISTYAGTGWESYGGDGGAATSAYLNDPNGVAFDTATGTLYIGDTDNHRVRAVNGSGTISTYAGTGLAGSSGDGKAANRAKLSSPLRLAVSSGNLYIADSGNSKVRRVDSAAKIFTFAGNGTAGYSGDGGAATSAQLNMPSGVASSAGTVYIAERDNDRVRRVNSSGIISTYAGTTHDGGDGGAAVDAGLDTPYGVAVDNSGNLFIADTDNNRIRRISGGVITTVAGTGTAGSSGDGGAATSARIRAPYDVAVDSSGNVYIADTLNNRIRKVDTSGVISTIAGTGTAGFSGDGGPATSAMLYNPIGVDVDTSGAVYVADYGNHRIRRISSSGTISTVAGTGIAGFSGDGGPATSAALRNPTDVEVDPAGTVYIADYGNNRVRKITSGTIRTVAGNGSGSSSGDGGAATSAAVGSPIGVAVDGAGNVYIASYSGNRIRKVNLSGIITTVAGTGSFGFSGDGGPAISAELATPGRVAIDPDGDFFIADSGNDRIRMVEGLGLLPGPNLTGSVPASPANNNAPRIQGMATAGTTVSVYTDPACAGTVAASGTAAELSAPGLAVSVPDDSTTSFYATATDADGRVSACSTALVYIEDSTGPAAPTITLAPGSPGSVKTPSWSFRTDAGATTQCELSSGGTVIEPYAPCTSPKTYDLTTRPDGSYTFRVRAKDTAGNTGAAASNTYVLDSTLPAAPTITSSPATPSNDRNPSWSFTVDAGSTAECEFWYEGAIIDPFAPCSDSKAYDLTSGDDGTYTFRVQARDGAGNPSGAVSSEYVLDTSAPATPTIDGAPSSPGNSTTPSWSFTAEPDAGAECELRLGGSPLSPWQACSSPESYDLGGEPDGSYTFAVRAVDAAGNTSGEATDAYVLDTTGPGVSITSSPTSPDTARDPSWSFSSDPGASTECELRRGPDVISPWTACTGFATYDLTGQPDGAYAFQVHAIDDAGNTGDPADAVYVLDTTPPVVSIDSGPAPISSERNPEWSFSTEPGSSTECELSGSGGVLQAFAPCTSPRSYSLAGQPDDTYVFSVRATDAAGNLGPASSSGFYLDTSGPVSSITSSPSTPGSSRSPVWSFTAEPGATTECELSSAGAAVSPFAPCVSPTSYSLDALPDGAYTFSVHAVDAAGNIGAPASHTYTLDTTPPATPSITSAPVSPSTLRTPSWSFTTEPGAAAECTLVRGGALVSARSACSSPASYSLAGLPDGDYTFRVRAADGVGNRSADAESVYTLDTTAPTVTLNGPPSPGNDRTPSWTFSTEPGAAAECQLSSGATVLQAYAPCGSPATVDLAGQPDADYTLSVRATDLAGNAGVATSATYTLDTGGPLSSIVSGPTSPGNAIDPSWAFTTEPGAATECELRHGATVVRAFAACTSPKSFDLTSQPDGEYTFGVRATDDAGNTGAVATRTYTFDATPPGAPILTSWPPAQSNSRAVSWTFSSDPGSTTECELSRGGVIVEPFASCTVQAIYSLNGQPDGQYTFRVRALDDLGNASAATTGSYILDTDGPTVTIDSAPVSPGSAKNPTWTFSTEAGASTECSLTGATPRPYAACVSPVAFDLTGELDGSFTLQVRATDSADNVGPVASSTYVLSTPAPAPGGGGGGGGNGGNGGGGNGGGGKGDDLAGDTPIDETPAAAPLPSTETVADPGAPASEKSLAAGDQREPERRHHTEGPHADEADQQLLPTPEEVREISQTPQSPGVFSEILANVGTVVAGLLEQPGFPLGLLALVAGFLVLQNRIDRRDPKLALAPVYPDPHLYFEAQEEPGKGR